MPVYDFVSVTLEHIDEIELGDTQVDAIFEIVFVATASRLLLAYIDIEFVAIE